MTTIEIVSMHSTGLGLNPANYEVAIVEENKLESHRSLFYDILIKQMGVIVHIGNPDCKDDKEGGYYAGAIIDWSFDPADITIPEYYEYDPTYNSGANQQYKFKFLEQFKPEIDKLLKIALDKSPIKQIYFLTDYQFGPENGRSEIINTITDFWTQHDNEGLCNNTLYEMYGP